MITLVAAYHFAAEPPSGGATEDGGAHLGAGWAPPEPGFTWSIGPHSTLTLPVPPGNGRLAIEIRGRPFIDPPGRPNQRLRVLAGGDLIADRRLGGDIAWWLDLPDGAGEDGTLRIDCERQPGGPASAEDTRDLGFRLERVTLFRTRVAAPPAVREPLTELRFGWNDSTEGWLGAGMGAPEDGYVWATGRFSEFSVPLDGSGNAVTLLLDMRPAETRHGGTRQRVAIGINGRLAGHYDLCGRQVVAIPFQPGPGETSATVHVDHLDAAAGHAAHADRHGNPLAWALSSARILPAMPGADTVVLPSLLPIRPGDTLDRAVHRLTGLDVPSLSAQFESLGNVCGLGLLQARLGREQPTLLRYGAILQRELVEGLAAGFAQLGRPDQLSWGVRSQTDGTRRIISDMYGITLASPYRVDGPPPPEGLRWAARAMPWLADKFLRDLADAKKIYVACLPPETQDEHAALAVLAMLRSRGDARMLWLTAEGSIAPGAVRRLPNGLLHGRLLPERATPAAEEAVLISLLANAWVLEGGALTGGASEAGRHKAGR